MASKSMEEHPKTCGIFYWIGKPIDPKTWVRKSPLKASIIDGLFYIEGE